ncbi:MAG: type II toxin-antitoxin system VapC family toxin [Thermoplasmata archaeon]|nr:type II toxin-antitoxin system VapC family toxin [Thermoplasmata archaeon]MBE3139401.1 type II toxin-antitoxin system VapC family toxin [Thermoplasmata archaeon]
MKVTCPHCKRRIHIGQSRKNVCACGKLLNYRHFLHEKIAYDVYLVDANILIYAFESSSVRRKYCQAILAMHAPSMSIATTRQIIEEVGSVIEQQLPEALLIYHVSTIPSDLTEIKTNFFKQPSIADLSLVQAAYEHPEVRGIITYDKDFARIATAGLVERKSSVKFWLGNAKQFVEKHRIRIKEVEEEG